MASSRTKKDFPWRSNFRTPWTCFCKPLDSRFIHPGPSAGTSIFKSDFHPVTIFRVRQENISLLFKSSHLIFRGTAKFLTTHWRKVNKKRVLLETCNAHFIEISDRNLQIFLELFCVCCWFNQEGLADLQFLHHRGECRNKAEKVLQASAGLSSNGIKKAFGRGLQGIIFVIDFGLGNGITEGNIYALCESGSIRQADNRFHLSECFLRYPGISATMEETLSSLSVRGASGIFLQPSRPPLAWQWNLFHFVRCSATSRTCTAWCCSALWGLSRPWSAPSWSIGSRVNFWKKKKYREHSTFCWCFPLWVAFPGPIG